MSSPLVIMLFIGFSFLLAYGCGVFIRRNAVRWHVLDDPRSAPNRKIHQRSVPLLGGIAAYSAIVTSVLLALAIGVDFSESAIKVKHLVGIGLGGFVLMIGGVFDDRFRFSPSRSVIAPCLAVIIVIVSGIGITHVTNPLGGQIHLDHIEHILFWYGGWPYKITVLADVFTFFWLLGMMYTTKFLDGLDGLVSGITIIGAVIIGLLALDPVVAQPQTALLAFIVAGAFAGFLVLNWHPASIFLGEGGSTFAGFILGTLAIVSGSKVATTILVFGIPILDVIWIIIRRIFWEKRSPFQGDRKHLHFRLLDIGLSHRHAVLLLYFFTSYFGITALFLQSRGKMIALAILTVCMAILGAGLVYRKRLLYKK